MPVSYGACNGLHVLKREHRSDDGGVSLHDVDEWDLWRAGYIAKERLRYLAGDELDDYIAEGPDGVAHGASAAPEVPPVDDHADLAKHLAEAVTHFLGTDQDTYLALAHIFEGDCRELCVGIGHVLVSALRADRGWPTDAQA